MPDWFEVAKDGSAYDAGFNPAEPRDWHGRWAQFLTINPESATLELSNHTKIAPLDELPDSVWREMKKEFGATDKKELDHKSQVAAVGIVEAFKELEKVAPPHLSKIAKNAKFVFADLNEKDKGIGMITMHDYMEGSSWLMNTSGIDFAIEKIRDRTTPNYPGRHAIELAESGATDDELIRDYYKLCMEHEFGHFLDNESPVLQPSRSFRNLLAKQSIGTTELNPWEDDFNEKMYILGRYVERNISNYALAMPEEAFAEGFCRWLNDPNFDPALKEFFETLYGKHRIVKEKKEKSPWAKDNKPPMITPYPNPDYLDKDGKTIMQKSAWVSHGTKDTTIGVEFHTSQENPNSYQERALGMSQANKGENEFERQKKYSSTKDSMHGAGIAIIDPNGNALFVKRSNHCDHPGCWAFPGGKINRGESHLEAAERETIEETGFVPMGEHEGEVVTHDPVPFKTFLHPVESQFEPQWLMEHTDHVWASIANPPSPLHPGVEQVLGKLRGAVDAGFDPNEPRDWHGKWTKLGEGLSGEESSVGPQDIPDIGKGKEHWNALGKFVGAFPDDYSAQPTGTMPKNFAYGFVDLPEGATAQGTLQSQYIPPPPPKPVDLTKINEKVAYVQGDDWNRNTALRLEGEYAYVKPELDKLAEGLIGGEVTVQKTMAGEWDELSGDAQEEVEENWKKGHYDSFYSDEQNNWYSEQALFDARREVAKNFNEGSEDNWAIDAIEGYRFPFKTDDILRSIKITSKYDAFESEDDTEFEFNDAYLDAMKNTAVNILPGMEEHMTKGHELLTEKMRNEIKEGLKAAFEHKADKIRDDLDAPDYLDESVHESLDTVWEEMTEEQKYEEACSQGKVAVDEDEEDEEDEVELDGFPDKFDPLNKTEGSDYKKTQALSHALFLARARQLIKDRHIPVKDEDLDENLKAIDLSLWDGWKDSSHGEEGMLIQVAVADELGGRLRTSGLYQKPEGIRADADKYNYKRIGGYEGIKAMIRAKWETTQWLLDKAGIDKMELYREIDVPDLLSDNDYENKLFVLTQPTHPVTYSIVYEYFDNPKNQELGLTGKTFNTPEEATAFKKELIRKLNVTDKNAKNYILDVNGYEKLPNVFIERNGALSTTTDPGVANTWGDSYERVVLRTVAPRTAAISVPSYGINVHSEYEVVIGGLAYQAWDAWAHKAPEFKVVPLP